MSGSAWDVGTEAHCDVELLSKGCLELMDELHLDILLIDTHPGLNEETLMSIAISDTLLIVMRPEEQDIQGTAVTVNLARKLDITNISVLINNVPESYDLGMIQKNIECVYNCPLAAVLLHSREMMEIGGKGIFSIEYPEHPLTLKLQTVADMIMKNIAGDKSV